MANAEIFSINLGIKALILLYIITLLSIDIESIMFLNHAAARIGLAAIVVAMYFVDIAAFMLASAAFIITLVRLGCASLQNHAPDAAIKGMDEGYEELVPEEPEEIIDDAAGPPTPYPLSEEDQPPPPPATEPPHLLLNEEEEDGRAPQDLSWNPRSEDPREDLDRETETEYATDAPKRMTIAPTALVSKKPTGTTQPPCVSEFNAQSALDKYTIEESLAKAASDGIVRANFDRYLQPLGTQYNVQGITETIVGYNYDDLGTS